MILTAELFLSTPHMKWLLLVLFLVIIDVIVILKI